MIQHKDMTYKLLLILNDSNKISYAIIINQINNKFTLKNYMILFNFWQFYIIFIL